MLHIDLCHIHVEEAAMKRSLRKGTAGISIEYVTGDYSNNLVGAEFELEELGTDICINIDLTGNLRVRNKATNSYADAIELIEDHASLKSVQIDDVQVVKGLVAAHHRSPNARWMLKLFAGERNAFTYLITPKGLDGSVLLNVRDM